MKLWAGRFSKDTDVLVDDFNSSISFDSRLYREDIIGSIAHARMLGECGVISKEESQKIIDGLKDILKDIEDGVLRFSNEDEDIHMFVERILTKRIGDTGKRLHTARSRNDQVALDIRLYLRKEIAVVTDLLVDLELVLVAKAKENLDTVMPGYTHLQRAQPITFAHHLMAYVDMFLRDIARLEDACKRLNVMPLGAGALAGTTYPIDRDMVSDELGFQNITSNSLDSVSDRDFVIEICSCLSIIMMHMSRFSEEIILWCSWEYRFIELDDSFSTGSSIMPQKKNPDVAELVRGKTGRVYGDLITILTVMKGLPLAYNKDMQEDKEPVFDALDTVKKCLEVFCAMFETVTVNGANMKDAALAGFINATDCADYLVKKGMPFRDAYSAVGKLVALCIEKGCALDQIELSEFTKICDLFDEEVYEAISLHNCVESRSSVGGPSIQSVEKHINEIEKVLLTYRS